LKQQINRRFDKKKKSDVEENNEKKAHPKKKKIGNDENEIKNNLDDKTK
jgi:hypothetical protein